MIARSIFSIVAAAFVASSASAATAPAEIKVGILYASSGNFAAMSMPNYAGFKLWAGLENANGGVFVKPYNKKIPIKLISYDDQSNTATAETLYSQLITQDKVDILVSDSGSVLTAPAMPLARNYKKVLFDQTGSSTSLFSKTNPYIVATSYSASTVAPKYLAEFLVHSGPSLGLKRVALIYTTNDYGSSQANAVRDLIKKAGAPLEIVYDQGVPTNTTNYSVLINNIKASKPDAVIQFGYPNNDIALLRSIQDEAVKFKFVFNVFPGLETSHLLKAMGVKAMQYSTTYVSPVNISYKTDVGLNLAQYKKAWEAQNVGGKEQFGFAAISGYTTGLVIQSALRTTESMEQLALRKAVGKLSGKLKTLDGTFAIDDTGNQIGEVMPLGQIVPDGKGKVRLVTLYPHDVASGKFVNPAK